MTESRQADRLPLGQRRWVGESLTALIVMAALAIVVIGAWAGLGI